MKKVYEKEENKTFEDIKHVDEFGGEFWYARELQKILEYTFERFAGVDKTFKMPKNQLKILN